MSLGSKQCLIGCGVTRRHGTITMSRGQITGTGIGKNFVIFRIMPKTRGGMLIRVQGKGNMLT